MTLWARQYFTAYSYKVLQDIHFKYTQILPKQHMLSTFPLLGFHAGNTKGLPGVRVSILSFSTIFWYLE